jgi:peptidoglycan-associated lipoprotein
MKKLLLIVVLCVVVAVVAVPCPSYGRGGGHGGGGHGGGGHFGGGWYGGGYHGYYGGWRGGPYYGGWYGFGPWWGYPYAYPYCYPYGYPYSSPYPSYPNAYTQPPVYIQPQQHYWYYCQDPQGYYPYVTSCPGGWMRVVPTPPSGYRPGPPVPAPASPPPKSTRAAVLQPIYFDLNKSVIRPDAAETLKKNLEWFAQNPGKKVRIQGNCDPRATENYNRDLGQRRADATKEYLVGLGVDAGLLEKISYGKDRPSCKAQDEPCWAKERRVDFEPMP